MEAVRDYFASIPTLHRSIILVGGIGLFWMIEYIVPLFKHNYSKIRHAGINVFFTLTTVIVNFALAFVLVKASDWAVLNEFGILPWLPKMPFWLYAVIGLLLLDFIGAYLIHWIQHKVKWMWMFHLVHHSDRHVDTTTANRHHPGESAFRLIFTVLAVMLTGAPMWLVFMYQSLSVVLSQFNHANIRLPINLDKALSWFIVTPDMHHTHHHYVLPYTDSNYGNIFSIWDRFFGTFRYLERDKLIYGVDTCMDPKENEHIAPMLKVPFENYRKNIH